MLDIRWMQKAAALAITMEAQVAVQIAAAVAALTAKATATALLQTVAKRPRKRIIWKAGSHGSSV